MWKGRPSDMDDVMAMISLLFTTLSYVFIMYLVVMVSYVFLGRNVRLTRGHYLASLGIPILFIAANVVVNIIFPDGADQDLLIIINQGISILGVVYCFAFYLFVFKEKRFFRAVEATVCYYLVLGYVSTLTEETAVYLTGGTDEVYNELFYSSYADGTVWLWINAFTFVLNFAIWAVVFFGFYRKRKQFIISIPYRILFVVWAFLFTVIPYVPAAIPSEDYSFVERYTVMSFMFGLGTLLLGLVVPIAVIVLTTERTLAEKNKYQETYLMAELDYIEQYKRKQTETRAFRHDIVNNLSMTQMMLEEGHIDEAKAHVSDMLGNVRALSPRFVTGDEMLDLIVSMKADKMEEKGISFTADGVIDGGLKIKPMDKCSIFANALDNAIEAASKCFGEDGSGSDRSGVGGSGADDSGSAASVSSGSAPSQCPISNGSAPSVSLSIKRTKAFFVIRITNTALGKVDTAKLLSTSGYTTKKDTEHHGFGLLNIRTAVENYNGMLKAESEDNSFSLSIMIPREG